MEDLHETQGTEENGDFERHDTMRIELKWLKLDLV